MTSITLSRDQATRLLQSLQHLHTLHGPCDGLTCPHAAVLRELEGMIYLAEASAIAIDHSELDFQWADPEFQAVAPFACQDPHALADALLRATTSPPPSQQTIDALAIQGLGVETLTFNSEGKHIHTERYYPTPRLCAACGATLPSTTSEGTNLCDRCSE